MLVNLRIEQVGMVIISFTRVICMEIAIILAIDRKSATGKIFVKRCDLGFS
jgi:hypothetical protein